MSKNELAEILKEKLSRAKHGVDTRLTAHLFFIEYIEELKVLTGKEIKEMLKSAGAPETYESEYNKMKQIAPHVTLKASYPPE